MPSDATEPVLRRMLRPGPAAIAGTAMSEARAWRVSLPRASEEAIGLLAAVEGLDGTLADLEGVLGDWDSFVLVLTLSGPDGARGLALVDAQVRAALIEVQTTGRVAQSPPADRAPTVTDAALTGHVIDAWIAGFAGASGDGAVWQTGRLLDGARAAKMALDDGEYRIQDLFLSFADGARSGRLRLVTPFGAKSASGRAKPSDDRSGLLSVEAELHAVLCRSAVALDWLRGLAPGSLLELPEEAMGQVRLEDSDGKLVARGRLGRSRGKLAVKLVGLGDPSEDEDAGAVAAAPAFVDAAVPEAPAMADLPLGAAPELPPIEIADDALS